jgi:hypothetical protein
MTKPESTAPDFRNGDEVVLTQSAYLHSQGSHAVFLRLKDDANWADIKTDGAVHSCPVAWLAHAECANQPQAK